MRLVRTLAATIGVGGLATLADLVTLTALVELVGLSPQSANVPALVAGAAVQFVGCRHLVFRATEGSLRRQLGGFLAVEAATLALNGLVFAGLVALTPLPYALARLIGTFGVFAGFSFPLWRVVFRTREA
ncbi:MAG: GtrA family protein [Myxococcota bacterium]